MTGQASSGVFFGKLADRVRYIPRAAMSYEASSARLYSLSLDAYILWKDKLIKRCIKEAQLQARGGIIMTLCLVSLPTVPSTGCG